MKLTVVLVLAGLMLAPLARADHQQLVDEDHRQIVDELVRPLIDEDVIVGCVVGIVDLGSKRFTASAKRSSATASGRMARRFTKLVR